MAYQFPRDLSMWPGFIRFTPYNKQNIQIGTQIELPLPSGLQFADGMTYENADLNMVGDLLATMASDETISGTYGNRYTSDPEGTENGRTGFQKLAADIGVKAGGNQVRALEKRTPNPNTTALFKQPNLRTFQFQFKLIPTHSDEVKTIERIIKEFRTHMYPQRDAVSDGDNLFYHFPQRFGIKMWLGNNKTISAKPIEPKIDYCYLTAMNTVFNSSTNAVMSKNGSNLSFAETDISLTFMETKALSSGKIRQGF